MSYGATTPTKELPWRMRAGRLLDFLGLIGFPLGLGVGVGYFASDRGVPLYPNVVEGMLVLGVISLLMVGSGRLLRGKGYEDTERGTRIRKRVVGAFVLATLLMGGLLGFQQTEVPTPLTSLTQPEYEVAFEADAARYRQLDEELGRTIRRMETMAWAQGTGDEVLSADEEAALRDEWGAVWSHLRALDELRVFHEDWWRFDPSRHARDRHLRSFLLFSASELSLVEASLRLALLTKDKRNVITFLDSPDETRGVPAASFSRMKRELQGNRDLARVVAVERYLDVLRLGFAGRTEAGTLGAGWLWDRTLRSVGVIDGLNPLDRTSLLVDGNWQILRKGLRRAWYPVQKEAAEKLGDTRTRRPGEYLITDEQLAVMDPELHPGDVGLSRKNWYLSNLGLPGFWPHAILYLGEVDKLTAYFDTAEVRAWAETQGAADLPRLLEQRHPEAWRRYAAGELVEGDEESHPYVVLEGISEGVVFNTWSHAAGDYLAVVRPRLSKLAKAQAIADAFTYEGKPYDFNFDFATDHTLVCTEVVWRAYRPAEGKDGLDIGLVTVAGRPTLPANELARVYTEQADADEANGTEERFFDFVWFYDTSEAEQRAFVSDEATFRATAARPQWDRAQR